MAEPTGATRAAAAWLDHQVPAGTVLSIGSDDALLVAALTELGRTIEVLDGTTPLPARPDAALVLCIEPRAGAVGHDLVVALCGSGVPLAFAAAVPGADADPDARWPMWWDDLFLQHGYGWVPTDAPLLWDDEASSPSARQALALYRQAPSGTILEPTGRSWPRGVVHPTTLLAAIERRDADAASFAATELTLRQAVADAERAAEDALREAVQVRDLHRGDAAALTREATARAAVDETLRFVRREVEDLRVRNERLLDDLRALQASMDTATGPEPATASSTRWLTRRLAPVLGRRPALFDESWYLHRYPGAARSRVSAELHYRRHRRVHSPHPLFDPQWWATTCPGGVPADADPLAHFLANGHAGGSPHAAFDAAWYAEWYAIDAAENPLLHYLANWRSRQFAPHPLFDSSWYLDRNPDVAADDVEPLQHFLRVGWREDRNPHPLFDLRWYRGHSPDVVANDWNPWLHYVIHGSHEGRDPHPLVETGWYRRAYPDVAAAGLDPLIHYLLRGAREGRNPGRCFDTTWYCEQHPEAAASDNPLVYFVTTGSDAGHRPAQWAVTPTAFTPPEAALSG